LLFHYGVTHLHRREGKARPAVAPGWVASPYKYSIANYSAMPHESTGIKRLGRLKKDDSNGLLSGRRSGNRARPRGGFFLSQVR
jgi:hypothetical protein